MGMRVCGGRTRGSIVVDRVGCREEGIGVKGYVGG